MDTALDFFFFFFVFEQKLIMESKRVMAGQPTKSGLNVSLSPYSNKHSFGAEV